MFVRHAVTSLGRLQRSVGGIPRTLMLACTRVSLRPLAFTSSTTNPQFTLFQLSPASFHTSSPRSNEHIITIQDTADFETRVTKNATPVIVDFFATWCGPCKLLGPRLETLISKKGGKVILAKIDIDEMTDLAVNHGVEAVPTVLAMKNGKVIDKFVGLKDDAALESFVDKLIN